MSEIKKKDVFVAHFHKVFKSRSLTPSKLRLEFCHQMKGLIRLHNPDKFLEDSSFGSNFRDLQKLA